MLRHILRTAMRTLDWQVVLNEENFIFKKSTKGRTK